MPDNNLIQPPQLSTMAATGNPTYIGAPWSPQFPQAGGHAFLKLMGDHCNDPGTIVQKMMALSGGNPAAAIGMMSHAATLSAPQGPGQGQPGQAQPDIIPWNSPQYLPAGAQPYKSAPYPGPPVPASRFPSEPATPPSQPTYQAPTAQPYAPQPTYQAPSAPYQAPTFPSFEPIGPSSITPGEYHSSPDPERL